MSPPRDAGAGCLGLLGFILVVALAAWSIWGLDPREAVAMGFKVLGWLYVGVIGGVLGVLLVAGIILGVVTWWDARRRKKGGWHP